MKLLLVGKRCLKFTLRGCSRATRALLDLPHTLPIRGHHRQRVFAWRGCCLRWKSARTAHAGMGIQREGGFGVKAEPLLSTH
jgi:hypothetical protein